MKHTPGPWALTTREGKQAATLDGSESITIVKSDGPMTGYIAHMVASGHYAKKLANARLIAAAPELLFNLQEVIHQAHNEGNGEYTIPAWFYNDIRAAIAAATD